MVLEYGSLRPYYSSYKIQNDTIIYFNCYNENTITFLHETENRLYCNLKHYQSLLNKLTETKISWNSFVIHAHRQYVPLAAHLS